MTLARALVRLLVAAVAAAYIAAGLVHVTNGWSLGDSAKLLLMDTRMAAVCYKDPARVWQFVDILPSQGSQVLLPSRGTDIDYSHLCGAGLPPAQPSVASAPGMVAGTPVAPAGTPTEQGPTPTPTGHQAPGPSNDLSQSAMADLRQYALGLVNADRATNGLPPVSLGTNIAAQLHADDMLEHQYLGHWWVDGRKPYMVYTQTGGTSYAMENAALTGWTQAKWDAQHCGSFFVNCETSTPKQAIQNLEYGMKYQDAGSNWGHRDNILGKTHRAVSIGIASDGKLTIFVEHFEGGDATAPSPPSLSKSGVTSFSITKNVPGLTVASSVSVYYDPPPTPKTPSEIETLHSYCLGGGFTSVCVDPIATILKPLPPGYYYPDLGPSKVIATRWVEDSSHFAFVANLGALAQKPGVYTFVVWRDTGGTELSEQLVELSAFQN